MHCLRYAIFCLIVIVGIIGNCSAVLAVQGEDTLTGDWGGNRDWLAQKGITFDFDVASFYPGVTSGGLRRGFRYGGHGDYVMNADFGKLGVQEGLFLKVRAEHRFGQSINGDTGAFLPATLLTDLPVRDSDEIYITNFLITQASHQCGVHVFTPRHNHLQVRRDIKPRCGLPVIEKLHALAIANRPE